MTPTPGAPPILWSELAQVSVVTTGHLAGEDVVLVLRTQAGKCSNIASDDPMASELLARLQRLPGFDHQSFIEAMATSENAEFVCWTRS